MSTNINSFIGNGHLTGDCLLKKTTKSFIVGFTIAINSYDSTTDSKESVSYIECKMFGERAEKLSSYLTKGSKVTVQGKVKQERWEKDGQKFSKIVVIVDTIEFQNMKKKTDEVSDYQPKEESIDYKPISSEDYIF